MMGGHNEILRMIFGIGGLIGVLLRKHPRLKRVGASKILLNWFLIIIALSIIDFLEGAKLIKTSESYVQEVRRLSELVEFLIALSGFLYVFSNFRLLNTTLGIKELKII